MTLWLKLGRLLQIAERHGKIQSIRALTRHKVLKHKILRHKVLNISYLLVISVPLLSLMPWYYSIDRLFQASSVYSTQLVQERTRQQQQKTRLWTESSLNWLNDYQWFDWQLSVLNRQREKNDEITDERIVQHRVLRIEGQASYLEWQSLLDLLSERYTVQPVSLHLQWLADNHFKVTMDLQASSLSFRKAFRKAVKKTSGQTVTPTIFAIPNRFSTPWPEDMNIQTILFWQDRWYAKLQLADKVLSIREGDWIPELSATLIRLDETGGLLRRQSINTRIRTDSMSENHLEKEQEIKVHYATTTTGSLQ